MNWCGSTGRRVNKLVWQLTVIALIKFLIHRSPAGHPLSLITICHSEAAYTRNSLLSASRITSTPLQLVPTVFVLEVQCVVQVLDMHQLYFPNP